MKTEIYAHRGLSGLFPENTMTAFQKAADVGADGIEFDVQLAKDGVPVVIHDLTINRTTNGQGAVKSYTSRELQRFTASGKFPRINERIPLLEELLEWLQTRPHLKLNVELKGGVDDRAAACEVVMPMLQSFGVLPRTVVSSFDHPTIKTVKEWDERIETAALTMNALYGVSNYLKTLRAEALHFHVPTLLKSEAEALMAEGVLLRPFTINDSAQLKRYMQWGCAGIFTDYPQKALTIRSELEV
ncbi:glycerophosphodiester phosphodiesterase [Shouchella shacheensis]|uniref:glycerophosphodiester phosphodiesterase n=1 Tax=Shouchella shacheensis TaxID=1649580 RepID=UPI00073FF743|nr:glycerophosphodiester phosphodiesterase family protein [Shouchella shacheensis]